MKPTLALRAFLLGSSLLAAASTANAATKTWSGTLSTSWGSGSAGGNWTNAAIPGSGDIARFNGATANLNTSLNAAFTIQALNITSLQTSAVNINTTITNSLTFNTTTAITVDAGDHKLTGTGTNSSDTSRDMVIAASSIFAINGTSSFEIAGRMFGSGSTSANHQKTGTGTLILSGNSGGSSGWNYGTFQVNEGVVRLTNSAGFGISGNNVTVASGAALEFTGVTVAQITGVSHTISGAGISGNGALRNVSGTTTIGTSANTGTITLGANTSIGADAGQLNIGLAIGDGINTYNLTKVGAGTVSLSGANTYGGTTTVSAGKLTTDSTGTINSTSGVTIGTASTAATSEFNYNSATALSQSVSFAASSTGGTLSGTGTITPAVTVTSGNTYTPGPKGAAGTQTLTGGITFNSGSIFDWDIDISGATETAHDTVNNSGGLAGSSAVFNIVLGTDGYTAAFWDTAQSWSNTFSTGTLASVFSSITGSGVIWDSGTSRGNVADQGYFTMSTNTLSWTAVPEPTSALAGLLLTAGLLRRRR